MRRLEQVFGRAIPKLEVEALTWTLSIGTDRPLPPPARPVAKIAALARIKVSEAELAAMVPELNGILAWVEQLGEVDVTGVEPMTAVIPNHLRLRDDVINADPLTGGGKRDAVLANAPAAEHGFFGVPKVIE